MDRVAEIRRHQDAVNLSKSLVGHLVEELPRPSLMLITVDEHVNKAVASMVLRNLARGALRDGRAVHYISGRDCSLETFAACLATDEGARSAIAREPLPCEPAEREANRHIVGDAAAGHLEVTDMTDDLADDLTWASVCGPPADLMLWDDVSSIKAGLRAKDVPVDCTPVGLRRLSRERRSVLIATVDITQEDLGPWERECDQMLQLTAIPPGSKRRVVRLTDGGATHVQVPMRL